ncbi:MAG: radical SAM protein [Deltaproteobacteria bacterium]|nr:radical SAM protein [Deltaproteobacteria bacterium]
MAPVLIYDDAPLGHDHYAGKGDFLRAVDRVRSGDAASIPVTLTTFHRLGDLARFAAAIRGRTLPPVLPVLDVRHEPQLVDGLRRHLREMQVALRDTGVSLGEVHRDADRVLSDFDRRIRENPAARPNLLRLLGVVCDVAFIGPHTFHMDITNHCNTNCTFCGLHSPLLQDPKKPMLGRRFTEGWKGNKRDWEEFCNLIDDLDKLGAKEDILFNGEGEPLTHPRAFDMVKYVCDKGMNLTLFSHGQTVREKAIQTFVDNDMHMLYWSSHCASPETYVKMQPRRKLAEFDENVKYMRMLVERKRKKNNKPHIVMAMVINADNFHETEKFMDVAAFIGVDFVRYQIMHSCGDSMNSLLMSREQFEIAKAGVERGKKKAEAAGIKVIANIDFQLKSCEQTYELPEDVMSFHWSHDLYTQTGCLVAWFFSRAFSDGLVSFCCHDKIVGDLRRERFRTMWTGPDYQRARLNAKAFDPNYNIDMTYAGCGTPLLAGDCAWCGNYEFINKALEDLETNRWKDVLRRVPLA